MRIKMNVWLTLLAAMTVLVSAALLAQQRLQEREYRIVSGPDVGFRVEGTDVSGKPTGRWMIRIDGRWVEPSPMAFQRQLTSR